jgi:cholera toxin transcriptional activator
MNIENKKIIIGNRFLFDPNDNSLIDTLNDDEILRLGGNESRVLSLLIQEPGKVVSRHELHEYVWRDQGFEVDDSSLTQAISTLRKMLQDPTKLPLYVKTVPKRGYQFISTAIPQATSETEESNPFESELQQSEVLIIEESITSNEPTPITPEYSDKKAPVDSDVVVAKPQAHLSLLGTITLIFAFILPIIAYINHTPKSDAFVQIASYDNTPVLIPVNHPNIDQWKPLIERCIVSYNSKHTDLLKPIEVIATGGKPNQITLNYIHSSEYSDQSISVRLMINQKEVDNICG